MKTQQFRTDSATYALYINQVDPNRPYTVFLHGLGFNARGEREYLGPLLNSRLNWIWFDQLGGNGSPAHSPETVTWDRMIQDIASIVREVAGGPVDVVGHCIGAQMTHSLVERFRPWVRSVVWYSPTASVVDTLKGVVARSMIEERLLPAQLSAEEKGGLYRFLATPAPYFGPAETMALLACAAKTRAFHESYWCDTAAMETYFKRTVDTPFNLETFVRLQSDYFSQPAAVPSYAGIPVLMLHSDNDPITPWDINGRRLVDAIPHAETGLIRGGAHWLQFEKTEECAQRTLQFLTSLPSTGR